MVQIEDVEGAIRTARVILKAYEDERKLIMKPKEIVDCGLHLSRAYQSTVVFAEIVKRRG